MVGENGSMGIMDEWLKNDDKGAIIMIDDDDKIPRTKIT